MLDKPGEPRHRVMSLALRTEWPGRVPTVPAATDLTQEAGQDKSALMHLRLHGANPVAVVAEPDIGVIGQ